MNDSQGLYRIEGSSTSLKITFSAEALKEITEDQDASEPVSEALDVQNAITL